MARNSVYTAKLNITLPNLEKLKAQLAKIEQEVSSSAHRMQASLDAMNFNPSASGIRAGSRGGLSKSSLQGAREISRQVDNLLKGVSGDISQSDIVSAIETVAQRVGATSNAVVTQLGKMNKEAKTEWETFKDTGVMNVQKLADILVIHSIIPDMVDAIEMSLSNIPEKSKPHVQELIGQFEKLRKFYESSDGLIPDDVETEMTGKLIEILGQLRKYEGAFLEPFENVNAGVERKLGKLRSLYDQGKIDLDRYSKKAGDTMLALMKPSIEGDEKLVQRMVSSITSVFSKMPDKATPGIKDMRVEFSKLKASIAESQRVVSELEKKFADGDKTVGEALTSEKEKLSQLRNSLREFGLDAVQVYKKQAQAIDEGVAAKQRLKEEEKKLAAESRAAAVEQKKIAEAMADPRQYKVYKETISIVDKLGSQMKLLGDKSNASFLSVKRDVKELGFNLRKVKTEEQLLVIAAHAKVLQERMGSLRNEQIGEISEKFTRIKTSVAEAGDELERSISRLDVPVTNLKEVIANTTSVIARMPNKSSESFLLLRSEFTKARTDAEKLRKEYNKLSNALEEAMASGASSDNIGKLGNSLESVAQDMEKAETKVVDLSAQMQDETGRQLASLREDFDRVGSEVSFQSKGIIGKFNQVRSGIALMSGEGSSKLYGLREAIFGFEPAGNIFSRTLDKMASGIDEYSVKQGKLEKEIATLSSKLGNQFDAMEFRMRSFGKSLTTAGVDAQLTSQIKTQATEVEDMFERIQTSAESTGKVSDRELNRARIAADKYRRNLDRLVETADDTTDAGKNVIEMAKKLKAELDVTSNATRGIAARMNKLSSESEQLKVESRELATAENDAGDGASWLSDMFKRLFSVFQRGKGDAKELKASINNLDESSGKLKASMNILKISIAGAFGGLAIANISKVQEAVGSLADTTSAQMVGFTKKMESAFDFKGAGDIAKSVFGNNFGNDMSDVATTVETVISRMSRLGVTSREEIQGMTEDAIRIRDAYNVDITDSINAAQVLMKNFGLTTKEAMNFIAGLSARGVVGADAIDSITEYSVQIKNAGGNAETLFNLLDTGFQGVGALGTDKGIDTFKEFRVRILDGSKTTKAALGQLGVNVDELIAQMSDGTLSVEQVFNAVIYRLSQVEDKSVQTQASVGLLGTQFDDMTGEAVFGLRTAGTSMDDLATSTSDLNDMYNTFGAMVSGAFRKVELAFTPIQEALLSLANAILPNVTGAFSSVSTIIDSIALRINNFTEAISGGGGFENISGYILDIIASLTENISGYFVDLINSGFDWGAGFMSQVASGIYSVIGQIVDAVIQIGQSIADYLMPGSPPKEGPLSTIDKWGGGLVDVFGEGLKASDFSFIEDALAPIDTYLQNEFGKGGSAAFENIKESFTEIVAGIRATGNIDESAFARVTKQLGSGNRELKEYLRLKLESKRASVQLENTEGDLAKAIKSGVVDEKLRSKLSKARAQYEATSQAETSVSVDKAKVPLTGSKLLKSSKAAKKAAASLSKYKKLLSDTADAEEGLTKSEENLADAHMSVEEFLNVPDNVTSDTQEKISGLIEGAGNVLVKKFGEEASKRIKEAISVFFDAVKESFVLSFGKLRQLVLEKVTFRNFGILSILLGGVIHASTSPIISRINKIITFIVGKLSGGAASKVLKAIVGKGLKFGILGAIVLGAVQNWPVVVEVFNEVVDSLKEGYGKVITEIGKIVKLFAKNEDFKKAVSTFGDALAESLQVVLQIMGLIKKVPKIIVVTLLAPIGEFIKDVLLNYEELSGGTEQMVNNISLLARRFSDILMGIVTLTSWLLADVLTGELSRIPEHLSILGRVLKTPIKDLFVAAFAPLGGALLKTIGDIIKNIGDKLGVDFVGMFDKIMQKGRIGYELVNMFNAIKESIVGITASAGVILLVKFWQDIYAAMLLAKNSGGTLLPTLGKIFFWLDIIVIAFQKWDVIGPRLEQTIAGVARVISGLVMILQGLFTLDGESFFTGLNDVMTGFRLIIINAGVAAGHFFIGFLQQLSGLGEAIARWAGADALADRFAMVTDTLEVMGLALEAAATKAIQILFGLNDQVKQIFALGGGMGTIIKAFGAALLEWLGGAAEKVWKSVTDWFKKLWDDLVGHSIITDIKDDAIEIITEMRDDLIELVSKFAEGFLDFLFGIPEELKRRANEFGLAAMELWDSLNNEVSTWPDRFKSFAHDMIDDFVDGVKDRLSNISEAMGWIKDYLPGSLAEKGPLSHAPDWTPVVIGNLEEVASKVGPTIADAFGPLPSQIEAIGREAGVKMGKAMSDAVAGTPIAVNLGKVDGGFLGLGLTEAEREYNKSLKNIKSQTQDAIDLFTEAPDKAMMSLGITSAQASGQFDEFFAHNKDALSDILDGTFQGAIPQELLLYIEELTPQMSSFFDTMAVSGEDAAARIEANNIAMQSAIDGTSGSVEALWSATNEMSSGGGLQEGAGIVAGFAGVSETLTTDVVQPLEGIPTWLAQTLVPNLETEGLRAGQAISMPMIQSALDAEDAMQTMSDNVVGHSIVPDMVNGIVDEFSRLSESALPILSKMSDTIYDVFNNILNRLNTVNSKLLLMISLLGSATRKFVGLSNVGLSYLIYAVSSVNDEIDNAADHAKDFRDYLKEAAKYADKIGNTLGGNVPPYGGADSLATGAWSIPYDNYPANLHKGETVLPASIASRFRMFANALQNAGVDSNVRVANIPLQNVAVASVGASGSDIRVEVVLPNVRNNIDVGKMAEKVASVIKNRIRQ